MGDRTEFCIPGKDYGLITEGDVGNITFQGTRFIEFSINISGSNQQIKIQKKVIVDGGIWKLIGG
ncbi:DUF2500 family protein [Cytobacillus horneckiae]|uniref:DUF2500 family protein n=1 Tax=Cytobacillus horneckiae TaxID=549687 RepID=UPI003D9A7D9B